MEKQAKALKIALIGTRGVPARHGGFETCAEEIGWRLAERGHQVIVYSKRYKKEHLSSYRGMQVVYIPRLPFKGIETLFAAFLSALHSLFLKCDIHMVFDSANSPVLYLFNFFRKKYAINPDGLGWKREKWGRIARIYYKWVEHIVAHFSPNIVADSKAISNYYENEYHAQSTVIEYGAELPATVSKEQEEMILAKYGLQPYSYILQITRFEPENNPLLTIKAFLAAQTDLKLMIIGGASKKTPYAKQIQQEAERTDKVILPGFIYDKDVLNVIWQNSLFYVHGNSVGGTNPALLQAMAAGRPIAAIDCVFNRETMNNNGYFFDRSVSSLARIIQIINNDNLDAKQYAANNLKRIESHYNWERITNLYENLFFELSLPDLSKCGKRFSK